MPLWQCRQWKYFSIIKKKINPKITRVKTKLLLELSSASGIKCKNAPAIKAPAEKPIKRNRIVSINLSLNRKVKIPTNEIKLTKILAPIAQIKLVIKIPL
jgi:hypothetical protein